MPSLRYVVRQGLWMVHSALQLLAALSTGLYWVVQLYRLILYSFLMLFYFLPHAWWYLTSPNVIRRVNYRREKKWARNDRTNSESERDSDDTMSTRSSRSTTSRSCSSSLSPSSSHLYQRLPRLHRVNDNGGRRARGSTSRVSSSLLSSAFATTKAFMRYQRGKRHGNKLHTTGVSAACVEEKRKRRKECNKKIARNKKEDKGENESHDDEDEEEDKEGEELEDKQDVEKKRDLEEISSRVHESNSIFSFKRGFRTSWASHSSASPSAAGGGRFSPTPFLPLSPLAYHVRSCGVDHGRSSSLNRHPLQCHKREHTRGEKRIDKDFRQGAAAKNMKGEKAKEANLPPFTPWNYSMTEINNRATLDIVLPVPFDAVMKALDDKNQRWKRSSHHHHHHRRRRLHRKKFPIVILITGGAWIIGSQMWSTMLARVLASRGYVVFCPDYRNFPQTTMEGMTLDVSDAISWVLKNAERYNGDLDDVTLVGQSAGAHLTMMSLLSQAHLCGYKAKGGKLSALPPPSPVAYNVARYNPRASIHRYIGLSGIYNVEAQATHFHQKGLNRSLVHKIAGGKENMPRYSLNSYFDPCRLADTGEVLPDNFFDFLPQKMNFLHGDADGTNPVRDCASLVMALKSTQCAFLLQRTKALMWRRELERRSLGIRPCHILARSSCPSLGVRKECRRQRGRHHHPRGVKLEKDVEVVKEEDGGGSGSGGEGAKAVNSKRSKKNRYNSSNNNNATTAMASPQRCSVGGQLQPSSPQGECLCNVKEQGRWRGREKEEIEANKSHSNEEVVEESGEKEGKGRHRVIKAGDGTCFSSSSFSQPRTERDGKGVAADESAEEGDGGNASNRSKESIKEEEGHSSSLLLMNNKDIFPTLSTTPILTRTTAATITTNTTSPRTRTSHSPQRSSLSPLSSVHPQLQQPHHHRNHNNNNDDEEEDLCCPQKGKEKLDDVSLPSCGAPFLEPITHATSVLYVSPPTPCEICFILIPGSRHTDPLVEECLCAGRSCCADFMCDYDELDSDLDPTSTTRATSRMKRRKVSAAATTTTATGGGGGGRGKGGGAGKRGWATSPDSPTTMKDLLSLRMNQYRVAAAGGTSMSITTGSSSPFAPFITREYLNPRHRLAQPDGLLPMAVSPRERGLLMQLCSSVCPF